MHSAFGSALANIVVWNYTLEGFFCDYLCFCPYITATGATSVQNRSDSRGMGRCIEEVRKRAPTAATSFNIRDTLNKVPKPQIEIRASTFQRARGRGDEVLRRER